MKIFFDQGTPVPLRRFLHPHEVDTASELGWAELENGDLLAAAERDGFDLMIRTDQNGARIGQGPFSERSGC